MNLIRSIIVMLLLVGLSFACQQNPKEETADQSNTESERPQLFMEGQTDWRLEGNADWKFQDGEIIGRLDTGSGFLMTKNTYDNFELSLEFYPDSTINSGVFTRCQKVELSPFDCFEFNIWDLHPNQDYRTGALVAKAKPLGKVDCLNKWNTYRIKCTGTQIEAWINDQKMVEMQDSSLQTGFIAIQAAGTGEVKFRNIVLNEIE